MRKPIVILTLTLLFFASVGFSNPYSSGRIRQPADDRALVTAVAQSYMDAYYTADVQRMSQVVHPEFHKRTLRTVQDGGIDLKEDTKASLLEGVRTGSGKNTPADQRTKKIEVLDIYKNAASVKVVNGSWIDYMLLTKADGKWQVLDVVLQYTR